jgi:hypothetical protein
MFGRTSTGSNFSDTRIIVYYLRNVHIFLSSLTEPIVLVFFFFFFLEYIIPSDRRTSGFGGGV